MRRILIITASLTVAAASAVPALAATKSLRVGDNYFVKSGKAPTVTVKHGTNVKWIWKGKAPHNVTVTKGPKRFASKIMTSGSYSKTINTKGTYTIVCTLHLPKMKMTLKVT